ncbi:hypothetical protein CR513_12954, partial [Mucuna pruriens]
MLSSMAIFKYIWISHLDTLYPHKLRLCVNYKRSCGLNQSLLCMVWTVQCYKEEIWLQSKKVTTLIIYVDDMINIGYDKEISRL